ncbi:hypothetical protein BX666DRAFT_1882693 [Dichotomocladium elegans]|nr:hypothetical protein BX666DRAFT_1882693 [Dichotomocladium elegans]
MSAPLSLTRQQQNSVTAYHNFCVQLPVYYCAICCVLLYKSETKRVFCPVPAETVPCVIWGFPPICDVDGRIVVCATHAKDSTQWVSTIDYPGAIVPETEGLNYRELACLSPIKLLASVCRNSSRSASMLGHYNLSGNISGRFNYDFAGYIFSGIRGIAYTTENHAG